jgi:hypothetical protein
MRTIDFLDVMVAIEEIFPNLSNLKWGFNPDEIHNLAEQAGITLQWKKIENWESFEYGHIDIPQSTFVQMLVSDDCSNNELMYLVTYEMLDEGKEKALELQVGEFPEFVERGYAEKYNIAELFYSTDVILVFPGRGEISILHHSGFVARYQMPDMSSITPSEI